jgi:glyoxylase-like metal-dependent hydrolase (beta-lactamase superfamily II)
MRPDNADQILLVVQRHSWTLREILIMHAHFDHVLTLHDLEAATNVPFYLLWGSGKPSDPL